MQLNCTNCRVTTSYHGSMKNFFLFESMFFRVFSFFYDSSLFFVLWGGCVHQGRIMAVGASLGLYGLIWGLYFMAR